MLTRYFPSYYQKLFVMFFVAANAVGLLCL